MNPGGLFMIRQKQKLDKNLNNYKNTKLDEKILNKNIMRKKNLNFLKVSN